MYKISKYTYSYENDNNELLLYNSARGIKSFCKIKNQDISNLFKKQQLTELSKEVTEHLYNKGIIAEESDDENDILNEIYLMTVADTTLNITINPTEQCNFRCTYCYESFKAGVMSKETLDKIIKFVKMNLHKYTGLSVMWFGGEPLLEMEAVEYLSKEFIQICNQQKKRYRAQITTNAYLLSYENFKKLLELKVNRFQVTVDGTREIHNSQRVLRNAGNTFDTVINNLKEIKQREKQNNFILILRTNVTKEIFEHMDEYLEWASYFCENDQRFVLDIQPVGNWLEKADSDMLSKLLVNNQHRKVYEYIYQNASKVNLIYGYLEPGGDFCYAGKKNAFLFSSTGEVHKCTLLFESEDSRLGELNNRGEINFDRGQNRLKWIANQLDCKNYSICKYAPLCLGCSCMAARNQLKNCHSDTKDTTLCSLRKYNIDIVLKLLDKTYDFEVIV